MDQHTKSRNTLLEGTLSDMLTQDNRTFVEMVAEMKPLLSTAYYCQQNLYEILELFMQEYIILAPPTFWSVEHFYSTQ